MIKGGITKQQLNSLPDEKLSFIASQLGLNAVVGKDALVTAIYNHQNGICEECNKGKALGPNYTVTVINNKTNSPAVLPNVNVPCKTCGQR